MGTKYRDDSWRTKRPGFRHISSGTLARWNTEPTEERVCEPVTVGLNTASTHVGDLHARISSPHELLFKLAEQIGWMLGNGTTEENCVHILGSQLTPEHINALREYGVPNHAPIEVQRVMSDLKNISW